MKTFQGIEISSEEVNIILTKLSFFTSSFTIEKLMDNIIPGAGMMSDYWEIRLSKVSTKDLLNWDNSLYTDGDNNGKSLLIKKGK